ncbi:hypothetical protein [Nitrincola alkalisediminis]|uniref:hypothetical protein n=1 Tax=Nitrincola alkalisediminis TaxID=1366656 RepID=UPI00187530D4|nr:hypothetical protein [Nitrincola alkalisediminis]
MSVDPIREYFDILLMASSSESVEFSESSSSVDMKKVMSLHEQGLITGRDESSLAELKLIKVLITPKGAVHLAEWGSLLEKMSIKSRIFSVIEKFAWAFVGMFFTVTGAILTKILINI